MDQFDDLDERSQGRVPNLPNMHLDSPLVNYRIKEFPSARQRYPFSGELGRVPPTPESGKEFHSLVGEFLLESYHTFKWEAHKPTGSVDACRNINIVRELWTTEQPAVFKPVMEWSPTCNWLLQAREKLEDFVAVIASKKKSDDKSLSTTVVGVWGLEHQHGYTLLFSGSRYAVGDYEHLLMLCDIVCQRATVYQALACAAANNTKGYPTEKIVDDLLTWGDRLLARHGGASYAVIKEYEGACVSHLHTCGTSEEVGDPHSYARAIRATLSEQAASLGDPSVLDLLMLLEPLDADATTQVFGLYRFWGHPQVDVRGGIAANRKISCAARETTEETGDKLLSVFVRTFFNNYVKKHGRPPLVVLDNLRADHPVRFAVENGGPIAGNASVEDLCEVHFKKNFDPSGVTTEHLLSDKALGVPLTGLKTSCESKRKGDWKDRRALYQYLHNPEVDLLEFLKSVDENGIDEEYLTIGVTPKERELKTKPRLFSLLTTPLKYYFGTSEYLLGKNILPYFPEITMTDSLQDVTKKVRGMTSQMGSQNKQITIIVNLDFEKWNLQMRNAKTRKIFSRLDELFGFGQVYSRTHDIFKACVFYCYDGFNWPDVLNGKIVLGDLAWTNQEGGVEGLRQKGWTIITVCAVMASCESEGVSFSLIGQGDNQVLAFHFDVVDVDPLTLKPSAEEYARVRASFASLKDKLYLFMKDFGLPIKTAESWSSSRVLTYGKNPYVEGIAKPMSLKRIARMLLGGNDGMQSIYTTVAGVFANGQAAAASDYTFELSYYMSYTEASRCLKKLMTWHPLLGGTMLSTRYEARKNGEKFSTLVRPDVDEQLSILMLGHVTVGGLPVNTPLEFLSRGFPDPLSAYFTWLNLCKESLRTPEYVKRIQTCWARPILQPGTPEFVLLLEDPQSVNLLSPTRPSNVLRKASSDLLQQPGLVRNGTLNALLRIGKDREPELVDLLSKTSPLVPNLLADILEATPSGIVRTFIAKFDLMKTMRQLAQSFGLNLTDRVIAAEKSMLAVALIQGTKEGQGAHMSSCSAAQAQRLREISWGRQDIYGVTSPHPFHFLSHVDKGKGVCGHTTLSQGCSVNNVLVDMGPFEPYIGSPTDQRLPQPHDYTLSVRNTNLEKLIQLQYLPGYAIQRSGPFESLLRSLLGSMTDLDPRLLQQSPDTEVTNFIYRYTASMVKRGGMINGLPTSYTHFDTRTSALGIASLGDGPGRPIHFQSLFSAVQHLVLVSVIAGSRVGGQLTHYFECTSCLETVNVDKVEGPDAMRNFKVEALVHCPGLWIPRTVLMEGLRRDTCPRVARPVMSSTIDETGLTKLLAWECAKCMVLETPMNEQLLACCRPGTNLLHQTYWKLTSGYTTLLSMASLSMQAWGKRSLRKYSTVVRDVQLLLTNLVMRLPQELVSFLMTAEQQAAMRRSKGGGPSAQGDVTVSEFRDRMASCLAASLESVPPALAPGSMEEDSLLLLRCSMMSALYGSEELALVKDNWRELQRGFRLLGSLTMDQPLSRADCVELLEQWCSLETRYVFQGAVDQVFSLPMLPLDWRYVQRQSPRPSDPVESWKTEVSTEGMLLEWKLAMSSPTEKPPIVPGYLTLLLPKCLVTRRWGYHYTAIASSCIDECKDSMKWVIGGEQSITFSCALRELGSAAIHVVCHEEQADRYATDSKRLLVDMSSYDAPCAFDWPAECSDAYGVVLNYSYCRTSSWVTLLARDLVRLANVSTLILGFPAAALGETEAMLRECTRYHEKVRLFQSNLSDGMDRFYIRASGLCDRDPIGVVVGWTHRHMYGQVGVPAARMRNEDEILTLFEGDVEERADAAWELMRQRFPRVPESGSYNQYSTWISERSAEELDIREVSPKKRRTKVSVRFSVGKAEVLRTGIWLAACNKLATSWTGRWKWVSTEESSNGVTFSITRTWRERAVLIPWNYESTEEFKIACACLQALNAEHEKKTSAALRLPEQPYNVYY